MAFHDLLGDGQPDAVAFVSLAIMQPLEHLKDPFGICAFDADAVVLDAKLPPPRGRSGIDAYDRFTLSAEFERVADQILKHLRNLAFIGDNHRKRSDLDLGAGRLN